MTICNHCRYEHSDCKGIKGSTECEYFAKPDVLNVKKLAEENEKLRHDLKAADEAYDIQGELTIRAEKEIERLKATISALNYTLEEKDKLNDLLRSDCAKLKDEVETLEDENEKLMGIKSRKMCDLCYYAHRIESYNTILYCGSRNGVVMWDGGKDCADFKESDTE